MKRILFTLFIALFPLIALPQVSITVDVPTAGGLSAALTAAGGNANTITNLTVTGNIDARDVKFMRDNMPVLAVLDIEALQIKAYSGTGGTDPSLNSYPADQMPIKSFYSSASSTGKTTLTNIKLPNSITSIGANAFFICTGLTGTLTIPNSVKIIGAAAFSSCTGFTGNLSIPNSVTTIDDYAFQICTGFTGKLTIPNSVTSIGAGAFWNCKGFSGNLTIPSSIISIKPSAFDGCNGFNGTLVLQGLITTIGGNAFYYCTNFSGDIIIPNTVTKIEHDAYMGCSGFNGVLSIPSSVTAIIDGTFYECSGLKKIIVNKASPIVIQEYAVQGINKTTCELIVPIGSKADYQNATGWKNFTNITEAIFVTLDARGGNPVAPITTSSANAVIAAPNNPIRDSYSFAGWYKEAACNNAWNFETDIVTAPITLYAKWTANPINSFTVNFNINGGSTIADIVAASNTSISEPTAPTKTGFSFAGWYKEAACTNAWNFTTDVIITNTTLYAKWEKATTIENQSTTDFKLFPNPATTTLNFANLPHNAEITIFSADGKLVKKQNTIVGESTINIDDLPKGVYLISLKRKKENMRQKFIKQ